VKNPKLTVNSQVLEFPIHLAPGSWIEGNGPDDCVVFGSKGESLGPVIPRGDWPVLRAGASPWQFSCGAGEGPKPRARVTVFSRGEAL
jgi:hypothetical protein